MTNLLVNQNHDNLNHNRKRNHQDNYDEFNIGNEDEDACEEIPQVRPKQHRAPIEDNMRRWKTATVKEILEFKGMLEDKRVPLVATRLRGRQLHGGNN
ncbi:conserved hypothetical protein [Ricinus communis]|uniref:Uncharacterized protein n=1 Tax=Ricinus communis TaxID=3988 RepID=B9S5J1_RICCO|nr:conserved hypothetical protein [Ricinus communis]